MNKSTSIIIVLLIVLGGAYLFARPGEPNNMPDQNINEISFTPIEHATMVLRWGDKVIYTDPVGGAAAFTGQPEPDLILITDIHGDHLDPDTLQALAGPETVVVVPQAVGSELESKNTQLSGDLKVLNNGESVAVAGFSIEAIPMYNLPEAADAFHIKGRGNGYVLEAAGTRVYISGDTEDIPEMRALQNIDRAFISMNLPYTMTVEQAADAVLEFKPKVVTPYHYRGPEGFSDVEKFRDLVNAGDPSITVDLVDFYPEG